MRMKRATTRLGRAWRRATARSRRALAAWRRWPPAARVFAVAVAFASMAVTYQVLRKPAELFALAPAASKSPAATWAAYGPLFREHATDVVGPELLAALAQAESAGDPLARTFWRWRWSWDPLDVYAPASSAVGLLQMTDATFAEARHLCVHDHRAAREGRWHDLHACWFNALYVRWRPGDAIEMTSAWLDQQVRAAAGARLEKTTPDQRRRLAAVIHLCGAHRGAAFARRGFRVHARERCGDHRVADYLARVGRLADEFGRLARQAG